MTAGFPVAATEHDGARRSDEALWDDAERPQGPPRDPDRTYSFQGQLVARHLVEIHDHLRGELDRIHDLIARVREGQVTAAEARQEVNDLTMRQNDWALGAYCSSYCTFVAGHHGLEDAAVFPHLKAGDERLAPVIDRLAEEHHLIHGVLGRVDAGLVHLAQTPGDLSELEAAVDLLTDALLSHLSYEEQQLLEPLARLGFFPGQV